MSIGKVIHSTRTYIYILTLLLFPNITYCQAGGYGGGGILLIYDNLKAYKDYRGQVFAFENKLKGMTTLRGYNYVSNTYDNAKREVNTYYDIQIQKAEAKYALTTRNSNPETHKSELHEAKSYKIYMHNVNKIELRRNKDLNRLEQQYIHLIKVYSPYWSRNDLYGNKYFQ